MFRKGKLRTRPKEGGGKKLGALAPFQKTAIGIFYRGEKLFP